jgi:UDP-glucose 4-epimerase
MRILITGITGRIGANLAAALLRDGHQVRGLVWARDPRVEKLGHLDIELLNGTITEPDDVKLAIDGSDAVYHLAAAFQGGGPFTESEYFEINVTGTFNMLKVARSSDTLRHFIMAGTDAVYGPLEGRPELIHEDRTPTSPEGWYGLSKLLADEMCIAYHATYGMPVTVLRFGYCFGAGEFLDFNPFLLSNLRSSIPELEALWKGEERLVIRKDESGASFRMQIIDVRDQVQGCVSALEKPQSFGQRIQLAAPSPFSFGEAVPYLSERIGIPAVSATVSGPPVNFAFDLGKAKGLIGFVPKYDVFRMIDDAVAFREGQELDVIPT